MNLTIQSLNINAKFAMRRVACAPLKVAGSIFSQRWFNAKDAANFIASICLVLAVLGLGVNGVKAQFNTGTITIDGTGGEAAYVTGASGNSANVKVAWDDTYLYFHYNAGAAAEPFNIFIDTDPSSPVSTLGNGAAIGAVNYGITPTLPIKADFQIYWTGSYAEYRTVSAGSFGAATAFDNITNNFYSNTGGTNRELKVKWTSMGLGSRPAAFNWMGYANSTTSFIFNQVPDENPSGGSNPQSPVNNYYYTVSATANGSATSPFTRKSFESRANLTLSTTNTFWDFTVNGNTLTLGTDITVNNAFLVNSGTFIPSGLRALNLSGTTSLTCNATITPNNGGGNDLNTNITSGTCTLGGSAANTTFRLYNLNVSSGATIQAPSSGTVDLGWQFGTITVASGGTLNFVNGTGVVNLTNSGTASTVQISALSGSSATFNNLTNGSGNTLRPASTAGTHSINIKGNLVNSGTSFVTVNGSGLLDITMNGAPATTQALAAATYQNLTIANTGSTLSNTIGVGAAGAIVISSGKTLTISSGARLDMGANALTVTGATSAIAGFLRSAAAVTGASTTTLTFNSGGIYEHNYTTTNGVIPNAQWNTGSTCSVIGYTTISSSSIQLGVNQSFYNFTWNTPNWTTSTGNLRFDGALTSVANNLTITTTNSKELRFGQNSSYTLGVGGDFIISTGSVVTVNYQNSSGALTAIINVTGNLNQTGGTLRLAHTSNVSVNYIGTATINVSQNVSLAGTVVLSTSNGAGTISQNGAAPTYGFSQTAGSIDFGQSTGTAGVGGINVTGTYSRTGTGTITTTGTVAPNGKFTFNGGASQTIASTTSGTADKVDFQINSGSTVTLSSALVLNTSNSSIFTVLSGGTLACGTNILSGATTSTFALNSGGAIKVGSVDANGALTTGAFGNIQTTTRTLDANAIYEYNGGGAQFTGNALPASLTGTLKINSTGVTLSQNTAFTGAGVLTLTSGKLTTNAKTLTLISSTTGSSTSYVVADATGTVTMSSVTTGKILPIGTASYYAPLTVATGSSTSYTAYVTGTTTCTVFDATKAVSLYWNLNGTTAPTSVTFQWPNSTPPQGASFAPASAVEMGRAASCPASYTTTTLGTPALSSGNYSVTASSGFATGANNYVIGNVSAITLVAPTVTTTVAANTITNVSAGSGGQTITGASLSAKGVVWNTVTAPTVVTNAGSTNDGTSTADFTSSLSGLSAQTLYYVRAYATNGAGTGYGNEVTFRTLSNPTTAAATGFSATTISSTQIDLAWTAATFPGSGATANGYIILRRSDATNPTTTNVVNGVAPGSLSLPSGTTLVTTITSGATISFSNNSGLIANQQYNYLIIPFTWDNTNAATYNYYLTSAPAANATTLAGAPTVTATTAASAISNVAASSGGTGLADGGSAITDKGVVWSTSTGPTVPSANSTNDGSGTADFTSNLTSLSPQTLYYVRAYVTNSGSTGYGNEITFRTLSNPPTAPVGSFTATTASNSQINLAWTIATFPGSGATANGYIILRRADGTNPATTGVVSGTAPGSLSLPGGTTLVTTITLGSTLSFNNTGLSSQTKYNYLIIPFTWDNSNAGTYNYYLTSAPAANATTYSNPPTAQPGSFTATAASSSQINLAWTTATYPGGTSTGYIILRRTDATDPTNSGVTNGVAPGSLTLASGTTLLTDITSGGTLSYNNTGLTASSQYNYMIIPYTWDGTNAATYSYFTTSPKTANATTTAPVYYWNGGTNTSNPANGGTGNWSGTNNFRIDNTGAQANWTDGFAAILPTSSGTVTLSTSVAPTSTTINASGYTLATSGVSAITLSGGVAMGANTLSLAPISAAALTVSGVISGTGGVSHTGAGTTTISGTNTYTGINTFTSGTALVSADLNLGAVPGSVTATSLTFNGGTLSASASFTLNANRGITLSSTSTLNVATGQTLTYGGIIAGTGGLTKTGAGILSLTTATSTYTGGTNINAGTITVDGPNRLGAVAGSITINTGTYQVTGSFTSDRNIAFANAASTFDIASGINYTNYSATGGTFSGAGILNKTGAGTLIFSASNAVSHTYNGLSITGGTVQINKERDLGSVPGSVNASYITLGGGTLSAQTTTTVNANRGITLSSSTSSNLDVAASQTLTYGGIVTGAGNINKTGSGTLTLSGTNTYNGTTTVTAGILNVTGSIASSTTTVSSTGTLSGTGSTGSVTLNGTLSPNTSGTIGTLASVNQAWNTGSTVNIDLNNVSGSAGTINDLVALSGTLTTSGTVNVSLAGTITGFSYATATSWTIATVPGGITNGASYSFSTSGITNSIGSGTFNISVSGNNLRLNFVPGAPSVAFSLTANSATGLIGSNNNVVYQANLAVTGNNTTFTGVTVSTISGAGTYTTAEIAASGFKLWYSTNSTFSTGTATQIGSSLSSATGGGESLAFTSGISQALTAGNTYYLYVTADYTVGATVGKTITVTSSTANYTFSSTPTTGTTGSTGGGTLQTISDYTTYTWVSLSSSPWLTPANWDLNSFYPGDAFTGFGFEYQIARFNGNTQTTSSINMNTQGGNHYLGAINYSSGATTARTISNSSTTVPGTLSLYGVVLSSTANVVIDNFSTGNHIITNGSNTMNIALANTTANVVRLDNTGNVTIASNISSAASVLSVRGSGTGYLDLTGSNTLTTSGNRINITAAELRGSTDAAFGAVPGSVQSSYFILDGGTLGTSSAATYTLNANRGIQLGQTAGTAIAVNTSGTLSYAGVISNNTTAGILNKKGAGTLSLTGQSSYTGATTVSAGTLQLNRTGGTTIPATNDVFVSGGTLLISTDQAVNNITISSGILQVASGVTLTINGTYSGSGGTINNLGTIRLNGTTQSFPGSGVTVNNGTAGTLANLTIGSSGAVTLTGGFTVAGTLSLLGGSMDVNGNTLTLNSAAISQPVTGAGSNSFTISSTAAGGVVSATGSGAHTITLSAFGTSPSGGLIVGTNTTLQMNNNAELNVAGNGTTTSMLTINNRLLMNSGTSSFITSGTAPFYTSNATLEYGAAYGAFSEWSTGTALTTAGTPQNVTINLSSGTVTLPGNRSMLGNLSITAGTFNLTSGDLSIGGNFSRTGTFTPNGRRVTFNGVNGIQTITGATSFDLLTISNTSASNPNVVLANNVDINSSGNLTLTAGRLVLGNNTFTMASTATLTGGSASSFVATDGTGVFSWAYLAATSYPSRAYPLGNLAPSVVYAPVTFTTFNNTGANGSLGLRTVASADPNINNTLPASSYINRYFPVTSSLTTFSVSSVQLRYVSPSEVTGTESALTFSVWNPTVGDWQTFGGSGSGGAVTGSTVTNTPFAATGTTLSARISTQLYYRTAGAGPGDWATLSTWEVSSNAGFSPLGTVTGPPNYLNAVTTTIRAGHTVNTTTTVNAGALTITGTLNLNSGVFNLVRTSGTDLTISATGQLNINNTAVNGTNFAASTVTSVSGYLKSAVLSTATNFLGTSTFNNGSTFEQSGNGGTIPAATWNGGVPGSTCLITGTTTTEPGGLNQNFYNLTWRATSQSQIINLSLGTSTSFAVQNNFSVESTNSRELIMYSQTSGGSATVGYLAISGGQLSLFNGGIFTSSRTVTLNITNSLTLSNAGIFSLTGNTALGGPALHQTFVYVGGDVSLANTAQITQTSASNNVSQFFFNKNSGDQNYNNTSTNGVANGLIGWSVGTGSTTNRLILNNNFIAPALSSFAINNQATLRCPGETYLSGGSGNAFSTFNLASGATLQIGSASGITTGATGNVRFAGGIASRTFNANANYTYIGAANQLTGDGLPSTVTGALTIANTGTNPTDIVTLTTNNTTVSTLNLASGRFAAGSSQTIKIAASGTVYGNGYTTYTGNQVWDAASGGTIEFTGAGSVQGSSLNLYNVTIGSSGSGVSFTNNATINNILRINANGFVNPNAPRYATGSTLTYSTGGAFNRSVEWGNTAVALTPGYPYHVTVEAGTALSLATNTISPATLAIAGDLTLGSATTAGTVTMENNVNAKPVIVNGNVLIGKGHTAASTFTVNKALTIGGDLTIGTGAAADALALASNTSGDDLFLYGSFYRYNNGLFSDNTRAVYLQGTSNATINTPGVTIVPGVPTQYFSYLRLDKTNGTEQITLNCPLGITLGMTFTKGIINSTNTNLLSVAAAVASATGTVNSFVNGPMAKATDATNTPVGTYEFVFPLGSISPLQYRQASVIPATAAATTTYRATLFPVTAGGTSTTTVNPEVFADLYLTAISKAYYWDVSRTGTGTARVGLQYTQGNLASDWSLENSASSPASIPSNTNIAVVHDNGSAWSFTKSSVNFADQGTPREARLYTDNGMVYSAVMTSFSPFAIGFGTSTILPVKLVSFTGQLLANNGKLNWQVADKKDLAGFELEYSRDGRHFSRLESMAGNAGAFYSYLHTSLPAGTHYYRLLVKEKSGGRYFSQVVLLTIGALHTQIVGLANNPVRDNITTLIFSAADQPVRALITDAAGRLVSQHQTRLLAGNNQWKIPATGFLSQGIYFLKITTADGVSAVLRFLKE